MCSRERSEKEGADLADRAGGVAASAASAAAEFVQHGVDRSGEGRLRLGDEKLFVVRDGRRVLQMTIKPQRHGVITLLTRSSAARSRTTRIRDASSCCSWNQRSDARVAPVDLGRLVSISDKVASRCAARRLNEGGISRRAMRRDPRHYLSDARQSSGGALAVGVSHPPIAGALGPTRARASGVGLVRVRTVGVGAPRESPMRPSLTSDAGPR